MEKVIRRTLFSFGTDKKIFNSLLMLSRLRQWQKMLLNLAERSSWKLCAAEVRHYSALSLESTLDFLVSQNNARCVQEDPIGRDALLSAKWIRKNLRILNKKAKLTPQLYAQVIKCLQQVDNSIHPPIISLEIC